MKTIIVLTDFSSRAENAAVYALNMAASIQADVLLFHAFELPVADQMGMPAVWPPQLYDDFRKGASVQLAEQAERLKAELLKLNSSSYHPHISSQLQDGPLFLQLSALFKDKQNLMLVMGTHRKGIYNLLGANHMQAVLAGIHTPVLIVPEDATYSRLCKIGFATDLTPTDIGVIGSLASLAAHTKADLMLAHIHTPQAGVTAPGPQVRDFLEEVASHINYPKVYYRSVEQENLQEGLSWLSEQVSCHILVMVHRHKTFLQKLFGKSESSHFAQDTRLPLLVFSEEAKRLPVF